MHANKNAKPPMEGILYQTWKKFKNFKECDKNLRKLKIVEMLY